MEKIAVISSKRLNLVYLLTNFKNFFFLCPLKTSENQRFSDVFKGYLQGTFA